MRYSNLSVLSRLSSLALMASVTACGTADPTDPPPVEVTTVVVSPSPITIGIGQRGTLSATAFDANGAAISNASFTWSSEETRIATVTTRGEVNGVATGSTTVTARSGQASGSAVVNVIAQFGVGSLEVVPADATIAVGETFAFGVLARDPNGQVVLDPPVTWSADPTTVASIDPSGVATGHSEGTAAIRAHSGGLTSGPATLTVLAPPCDGIGLVPSWTALLDFDYAAVGNTPEGNRVEVEHHAQFDVILGSSIRVDDDVIWEGAPAGTASINDRVTAPTPPPNTDVLSGAGPLLRVLSDIAPGGAPLPTITMTVNLSTCRYRFEAVGWIVATLMTKDGDSRDIEIAVGAVFSDWMEVGTWRTFGLNELVPVDFAGHSGLGFGLNPTFPTYIPSGFGQLLFPVPTIGGPAEAPVGAAGVTWAITPRD